MKSLYMPLLLLFFLLLSPGCGEQKSITPTEGLSSETTTDHETTDESHTAIDWFQGSIEEAFELAIKDQKAIYLYWGAVWCPPCQEIKNTVFKSKQFIALSKLFIPVYLDGDTSRAQWWGEHFGVAGYPTMIVFNPAGEEVTRIPGGIDVSKYSQVLELSLNHMRPTAMLIGLATSAPDQLQESDFIQLAYYSWQQDNNALPAEQGSGLFLQLSDLAQKLNAESSARLYLQYLSVTADEQEKLAKDEPAESLASPGTPIPSAADRIEQILASDELVIACWDYLNYNAESLIQLVTTAGEQRNNLVKLWQTRVLALHTNPSLTTAEQLAAWLPTLKFFWLTNPDGELGADTLAALRADIGAADTATTNTYARQSVINQATYLLETAKLSGDAEKLLLAELDKSNSPYYFMSDLAYLAENNNKPDEAIHWRKRAYDESTGSATRLQWGASYVKSLIRLRPEEADLIQLTATGLIDDLQGESEAFSGRNFRVMRSLNKQLIEWQSAQGLTAAPGEFQAKLAVLCAKQQPGSLELKNCQELVQAEQKPLAATS
jgi:thioredoxin-related protein